ncbi:MAG: metallophosphoesterase [Planctomycetes bacterium]|nr:metallophosphoesterase [Planctomycetota bacterium]
MTTIAHLSDLHFGSEDPALTVALREDLLAQRPDVVVVSGDLTQRARSREFAAATAWLESLPFPRVVVPGNHDVPLWNPFARLRAPLARFHRHHGDDAFPAWRDQHTAVIGLCTARSLLWKAGRISAWQVDELGAMLRALPAHLFKVVVTHHPFVDDSGGGTVGGAARALDLLEDWGVDLLLAGHLHRGFNADVTAWYPGRIRSIIVAQAGTALSVRRRGEANGYNLIAVSGDRFAIAVHGEVDGTFTRIANTGFRRSERGWITCGAAG